MKNTIATNVYNAAITASSENPDHLFSVGLVDSRLSRTGRTLSDAGQWVKFAFAAAVDADTVCIFGSNVTSGATVKIQANATDVWTSPPIDQALTYTKNDRASLKLGRSVGEWSHQFSSTESYQYWRLYVDDGSNPDTYIELGFIFIDESIDFPGMSVNQVIKRNTTSEASFSSSGQGYGLKRNQYNTAAFNFPTITATQKDTYDEFFYEVDIVTPYLMLIWESSIGVTGVQGPLYVMNTDLPEWKRVEGRGGFLCTTSLNIREAQ